VNRRLTRSRDAMVGGVAAGVANWIGTDPTLVRIAWALLVPLTAGGALLAYIVAWVVVPEEPRRPVTAAVTGDAEADATSETTEEGDDTGRSALFVGGGLVLIGLWFLVREYLPAVNWGLVWPLLLVGAGIVILVGASRRR
jgi:phage shock protein C